MNSRQRADITREVISLLGNKGLTYPDIAEMAGVARYVVAKIAKDNGMQRRRSPRKRGKGKVAATAPVKAAPKRSEMELLTPLGCPHGMFNDIVDPHEDEMDRLARVVTDGTLSDMLKEAYRRGTVDMLNRLDSEVRHAVDEVMCVYLDGLIDTGSE